MIAGIRKHWTISHPALLNHAEKRKIKRRGNQRKKRERREKIRRNLSIGTATTITKAEEGSDVPGNPFLHPSSSAPEPTKKIKTNTSKIQKIPNKICVVDNLMREARSKFQVIWTYEQLSAKKTNWGSVKMFTVHVPFWPDLSFLLRAAYMSKWLEIWIGYHASNCLPHKFFIWNFLNLFWIFYEFLSNQVQMSLGTKTPYSWCALLLNYNMYTRKGSVTKRCCYLLLLLVHWIPVL